MKWDNGTLPEISLSRALIDENHYHTICIQMAGPIIRYAGFTLSTLMYLYLLLSHRCIDRMWVAVICHVSLYNRDNWCYMDDFLLCYFDFGCRSRSLQMHVPTCSLITSKGVRVRCYNYDIAQSVTVIISVSFLYSTASAYTGLLQAISINPSLLFWVMILVSSN